MNKLICDVVLILILILMIIGVSKIVAVLELSFGNKVV